MPVADSSIVTDSASHVAAETARCAELAAKIGRECEAMIGDCRPIEVLSLSVDAAATISRQLLQLYDGIAEEPEDLASALATRREVETAIEEHPERVGPQGNRLDEQALELRRLVRARYRVARERALAESSPELADRAEEALRSRLTRLERVIGMAPTGEHVDILACSHPPPWAEGVPREHRPAFFLRRLALEPLAEVADDLQATASERDDDIAWLASEADTITGQLVRDMLETRLPENTMEPAVDRLLAMAILAAEAAPITEAMAREAARAVRRAGVGQAGWLRERAADNIESVRRTSADTVRLASEIQVGLWRARPAARSLGARRRFVSPLDERPKEGEDPLRGLLLASIRTAQGLARDLRHVTDLLDLTVRLTRLGADAAEISAWSAAVVVDPGASTNLRVFFLRHDRCRGR